jgi:Ca-activated chloride channel family protein
LTVTALYEIVPRRAVDGAPAAELRYQQTAPLSAAAAGGEVLSLKLRYKTVDARDSRLRALVVRDDQRALAATSPEFRFAAAVATFGLCLRDSPHRGAGTFTLARTLAAGAGVADEHRREFLALVDRAARLAGKVSAPQP